MFMPTSGCLFSLRLAQTLETATMQWRMRQVSRLATDLIFSFFGDEPSLAETIFRRTVDFPRNKFE